jgi:hypothetical protein
MYAKILTKTKFLSKVIFKVTSPLFLNNIWVDNIVWNDNCVWID